MKIDLKKQLEGIDEPLPVPESWNFIKKGKICVKIIYEDMSYKDYYVKFKDDYTFQVKKKSYRILPQALIMGKRPTFVYWYNNPCPINLKHKNSSMAVGKTKNEEGQEVDVILDAKALKVAFDSNLINKLYHEPSMFTTKNVVIILIVVAVIVLVILQVTGTVDVMTFLTGAKK